MNKNFFSVEDKKADFLFHIFFRFRLNSQFKYLTQHMGINILIQFKYCKNQKENNLYADLLYAF